MVIDLLDANESTWAFVVTDSVDADVGQQVAALAMLATRAAVGHCGRTADASSDAISPEREGVLAVRGARQSVERAPPTPIDPARLARRGFAFDFAEVALDESDYLGVPCGDVDLVLHE